MPKYRGMLGTVATIAREEGMTALWKGIVPGLHRQCVFGGLRIGLYEPLNVRFCTIQEGLGALWTGIGPNVARNAIINAAELASYDQVKQVKKLFAREVPA
ncbi:hypothetical protein BHE74_00044155 [Ensete ventricosum]|nr:hypothetical protein BHE74_00044155 [Ensete ventricosum]